MAADAPNLQMRFATAADATACNEFYNRLRGTNRTLPQWRWEFTADGGNPPAYLILEHEGAVAGLQALIPVRMISPGGLHRTAKSEDTLVDPTLRGSGAFATMYAQVFERAREAGFEAIWGFTEATRAFEGVGFRVPAVTKRLALPIRGGAVNLLENRFGGRAGRLLLALVGRPLMWLAALAGRLRRTLRRISRTRVLPVVHIKTALEPPSDCEMLMDAFVATWGGITIFRDAKYLSWRVFTNPWTRPVMRCAYDGDELVGWVIYALGGRQLGYIVDVIAANPAASKESAERTAELLLADAANELSSAGAVAALLMTATNHPFDAAVRRACRHLGFMSAGQGSPTVLWTRPTDAALDCFDDWYVTRLFTEGVDG